MTEEPPLQSNWTHRCSTPPKLIVGSFFDRRILSDIRTRRSIFKRIVLATLAPRRDTHKTQLTTTLLLCCSTTTTTNTINPSTNHHHPSHLTNHNEIYTNNCDINVQWSFSEATLKSVKTFGISIPLLDVPNTARRCL